VVNILGTKRLSAQNTRQGGFAIPLFAWAALGAGAVILALGIALKVQSSRLETAQTKLAEVKGQYAAFKGETKRLGDAAEKRRKDVEAKDRADKEKADAENKDLRRELDARRKQLRDRANSPGGSVVPSAPASAESPDRICFDRKELTGALQRFVDGVAELVGEGAQTVIDLDTAKNWAQKRDGKENR
jgi:hypothetical protein